MPFQDDNIDRNNTNSPLVSVFSAFAGQVERVIVVNLAWSAQLIPTLLVFANPALPSWLRATCIIYTGVALIPATG
jgi:hypothetical protein